MGGKREKESESDRQKGRREGILVRESTAKRKGEWRSGEGGRKTYVPYFILLYYLLTCKAAATPP